MVSVLDGMVRIVVLALVTLVTGNFVLVVGVELVLEGVCVEMVVLDVLACEIGVAFVVLCVVSSVLCAIVVVLDVVMVGVVTLDVNGEMFVLESSVVLIVWVSVVVLAMVEGTDIIVV